MNQKKIIFSLLTRIEDSILLIQSQSTHIKKADDFVLSPEGTFTLSGVCMLLIYIGESIKSIDAKTESKYLVNYPEIPWTDIMGLCRGSHLISSIRVIRQTSPYYSD